MLDPKYPLKQTPTAEYEVRTEWNVRDSSATLIITRGRPTTGTGFTIGMTRVHKKPCLIIDLEKNSLDDSIKKVREWFSENKFSTLNVAGPRESNSPGIYEDAKKILWKSFVA